MNTKSGRGRGAVASACPPPNGTGALTTCKEKALFNLTPLINISNHTRPSTEGEEEEHTSRVGSLRKERACEKRRGKKKKKREETESDEVRFPRSPMKPSATPASTLRGE